MTEEQIVAAIAAKGNEIRDIKNEKNPEKNKETIARLVQELLALKERYKAQTGKDFAPSKPNKTPSKKQVSKETQPPKTPTKKDVPKDTQPSKNQAKKEKKQILKKKKKESRQVKQEDPIQDEKESVPTQGQLFLRQAKFQTESHDQGQIVTPWDVEAENGVNYDKLIEQFGCAKLDSTVVDRFERLTGHKAHRYLRRGFFFAHRDLNELLDAYEKGESFYLYTGRGPSSGSLHMGHLIPFTFNAWLQKVFQVPLVIQLTDDEKFLFRDQTLEDSRRMMLENVKDIITCGFDIKKTFIFGNTDYIQHLYPQVLKVQKCVTYNQARGIFGFTGSDNIGKSAFPAVQAVPSFPETFPIPFSGRKNLRCLIPCAIDQDPYFRMTRDVASRLDYLKPATIYSKFFPALQGSTTKMSASKASTTIYLSDSAEEIANKIKRYAFSGGGETRADHEKHGANLKMDIPFQYLSFMLEDDKELEIIAEEYGSGRMMSGQVKEKLIQVMTDFILEMQERRQCITQKEIEEFMRVRPLEF